MPIGLDPARGYRLYRECKGDQQGPPCPRALSSGRFTFLRPCIGLYHVALPLRVRFICGTTQRVRVRAQLISIIPTVHPLQVSPRIRPCESAQARG